MKAYLITNPVNIEYLSSFTGSFGIILLIGSKKYLLTDPRYFGRAKKDAPKDFTIIEIARKSDKNSRKSQNLESFLKKTIGGRNNLQLGLEENFLKMTSYRNLKKLIKAANKSTRLFDSSDFHEKLREQKNEEEISNIEKSQKLNEKIFLEILQMIDKNRNKKIREIDLSNEIKILSIKYGASDISFPPIVAFDKNSAIPHHEPGNTTLQKNSLVLIDMGMKYKGYCSDMTRTILPPNPSEKQKEIYDLVLQAQMAMIRKAKPGISGAKLDHFGRSIIEKAGYGKNYTHGGGHGTGLEIHEKPSLSDNYTEKLKENSVITIEPGIYIPGEFGVRIEDMLLLTKNGNRNLTKIGKL